MSKGNAKGIAVKDIRICTVTLFIPVNCSSRRITSNSRDHEVLNNKKLQILPTCVLFLPEDPYDTYVKINKGFQLNINICNVPAAKAHIWFDIGDILRSSFIS